MENHQDKIIEFIENRQNIFITGPAGTGKSYLLRLIRERYISEGLSVTAASGIAAVNVGGLTLHSWAGMGMGNISAQQCVKNILQPRNAYLRKRIRSTRILAIDEVSMISAHIFNNLDHILRVVRHNDKPFGGICLALFGDFLQLPPVFKNDETIADEEKMFCFESEAWQNANLKIINLNKSYRQGDIRFVELLNNIRYGNIFSEDLEILKSRTMAHDNNKEIKPTILCSHNYVANKINEQRIKEIIGESKIYQAKFSGNENKFDYLKKNCLAPVKLELKVGAQVIMLKNTYQKEGVINGSLGIIRGFSKRNNHPIVEFSSGAILIVGPENWETGKINPITGENITDAVMTQIPLNLSWAITIHKAQGMTLDKIECDLANCFAEGQTYVAISRAVSLQGLFLKSFDVNKIIVNKKAVNFYKNL